MTVSSQLSIKVKDGELSETEHQTPDFSTFFIELKMKDRNSFTKLNWLIRVKIDQKISFKTDKLINDTVN